MIQKNKIKISLAVLAVVAVFGFLLGGKLIATVRAVDLTGWLWNGGSEADGVSPWDGTNTNFGWINVNCASKIDTNNDGTVDDALKICNAGANLGKNCNGAGAVACPGGSCVDACSVSNYKVEIPDGPTGDVSGYAWSENLGWISFTETDLAGCPAAPCKATRNGDNLEGWARIMSIAGAGLNSGGWQGWIRLRGANYGVTISDMMAGTSSFGWSDELGWVDFKQARPAVVYELRICQSACSTNLPLVSPFLMNKSDSVNLKACKVDSTRADCNGIDATGTASWDSDNSSVATVDGSGDVDAIAEGTANITAEILSESLSDTLEIKVACVKKCNDGGKYCKGEVYDDANGCGTGNCPGEKNCGGQWKEVVN